MEHHIVVIGSGPGGFAAALEAMRPGVRVTVVERSDVGGTCLNRGCIPTKIWRFAAETVERLGGADDFGVHAGGEIRFDSVRLLEKKRTVVETLREGMYARLKSRGVRFVSGIAAPTGPGSIVVCRADGTAEELRPDSIILASGSEPAECPGLPFHMGNVLSTDDALELREQPRTVLIVGGGANGCEFASIFAALGVGVTLVEAAPRLLPSDRVDADVAAVLLREMKKRGVRVHVNRTVAGAEPIGSGVRVRLRQSQPEGDDLVVAADIAVVATGRKPSGGMGEWKRFGLAFDDAGWVGANARLETAIEGVYAVGDALGPARPMLAHVASMEGAAAAANALGGNVSPEYGAVPYAVYSIPEAAGVGLAEAAARKAHPVVRSHTVHMRSIGRAQTSGDIAGFVKIVADGSGRILGVHIIGSNAAELVAEGTLAVRMGMTVADLASTVHAHPTFSEAIWEAARAFAEIRDNRGRRS